MKWNIYGAKMLVVDLILVSIWAILFSRCVSPGILLLIPIRGALSFEMHRMSPWTLVSAIGFMMAYLCCGHWTYPFEKMAFGFFNVVLDPDSLSQIYSEPLEWEMKVWINSFAIIGLLWMAVMPVVMGIRYRNLREIKWSRKWIWLYLVPFLAISIWATLKEGEVGIRDRYGLILPIEYGELKALDRGGRFVRTNSVATWNYQGSDNRYGVFDTYKRVFVIDPKDMAVTDLEMIGEKSYLLYGANGQPFATLYLPGLYDGRYNPETRIEPYTADAPVHKLLK